jgi:hypothetical protein
MVVRLTASKETAKAAEVLNVASGGRPAFHE